MAAIDVYLQRILDAVYGEEVRGSIHDAIYYMNIESTSAYEAAISARTSAKNYAEAAEAAATRAEALSINTPYIGANGNWWVYSSAQSKYIDTGTDASITVSIADVTMLSPTATPTVTNSGTNTDPIFHLGIPRAQGVTNVAKTGTSGLVDTYTMTYGDGVTLNYTVTNGEKGDKGDTGNTGPKGDTGNTGPKGDTGLTPNVTANATVDSVVGTPTVTVTKSGTTDDPVFSFAFSGLKGADGTGSVSIRNHGIEIS